jgi:tetratricopeptide (TPR) repeat protein
MNPWPNAGAFVLFALAATGVATTQPRLARTAHEVKERDDVAALPSPAELHAAVLGWDAAAVDLLWANLLAQYGIHSSEHRDFTEIPRYLDAILELEPNYAPVYEYVDTLLAYRPIQGTEDDARKARAYLEQGTRVRSEDPRVWAKYGQFLAFLAPSFLSRPEERTAWRRDGAEAIGHAVELGADADQALTAASMLSGSGATEQAIRYLEHAYSFTEHPMMRGMHERIRQKLDELQGYALVQAADDAIRTVETRRQNEMPYLSRDFYLVLGPAANPARCAGVAASDDGDRGGECARAWSRIIRVAQ